MSKGRLYVISGPSGVGKGTIISKMLKKDPNLWKSVSATTRSPRKGEIDGQDYFFLTHEAFERGVNEGDFLEWARYSDNLYGTPRKYVEEHLDAGEDVILEIEVQGAVQVKEAQPDAILVFILPPSMEVLEGRLRGRASEDDETILKRLEAAKMELAMEKEYNCSFVNDDLDVVVEQITDYIANNKA